MVNIKAPQSRNYQPQMVKDMNNEIVLYSNLQTAARIEVRLNNDTVWLNRLQMSVLFGRDVKTIGKHINNVYAEEELQAASTVANFAIVQNEGGRVVERTIEFYNLDLIISVGYRVKSKQATQFRIWATQILKDYLLKGYAFNQRINRIEDAVENVVEKVKGIELHINNGALPQQGIFFDGQVFDAYAFVSGIVKKAKHTIVLIDNYIDETTITLLSKRNEGVAIVLLTQNCNTATQLDVKKANEQYGGFKIKVFTKSHDRFLIIDQTEVYHLGASLKDLGKKWFAFTKMDLTSVNSILKNIPI